MRIECPTEGCPQAFEIDESYASRAVTCPSCEQPFQCPTLEEMHESTQLQQPAAGSAVADAEAAEPDQADESVAAANLRDFAEGVFWIKAAVLMFTTYTLLVTVLYFMEKNARSTFFEGFREAWQQGGTDGLGDYIRTNRP